MRVPGGEEPQELNVLEELGVHGAAGDLFEATYLLDGRRKVSRGKRGGDLIVCRSKYVHG